MGKDGGLDSKNEDQFRDHSNEQTVDNAIEDQIGENLDHHLSHPFTDLEEELFRTRYEMDTTLSLIQITFRGYIFIIQSHYQSMCQQI